MVVAGLLVYLLSHAYAWRLRGLPMTIEGIGLKNVYCSWAKDGYPQLPEITNYVVSSSARHFVFTNRFTIKGEEIVCQFAVESRMLGDNGLLAISRDGKRIVWIDKKTGPEIIDRKPFKADP
jgi:hypothetical protein